MSSRSLRRSSSYFLSVCSALMISLLTKSAGDVVFRLPFLGGREEFGGRAAFYQLAEGEKSGVVGHPGGLLHVVGDDHDGKGVLKLVNQLFDFRRGDRVQRRARLVHQQPLRV